ncbi:Transcriptional regulator [Pseudomonas sp. IT-196MI5]
MITPEHPVFTTVVLILHYVVGLHDRHRVHRRRTGEDQQKNFVYPSAISLQMTAAVKLPKLNAPDLGNTPSTSEIITRHLRDAIVAGHFAEDEPIRQDDIARQFNVSKIPVREALKRLEAEGLVMFQRNRGAMVTRVSDAELAQMFEVRMLLEDKILRLAIPNMTEETFTRAERICQEFIGEDDVGRWAELNWELHACLYEPAQRPFLVSLIRSVNDKLERYLRMQMSLSAGKERADHEHREILAACRAGDVDLAVKLLDEHIAGVCTTLFEHLPHSH